MSPRSLPLLALAGLLVGCSQAPAHVDGPDPLSEAGVTFAIQGALKGPKVFLSTSEIAHKLKPFAEEALPGVRIILADAKMQPLADAPTTVTGADGRFELASPHRAGFLMARMASASAPIMAFYRDGRPAAMSVASSMVAWKLSADMTARSVAITTLDPAKIDAVVALVNTELVGQSLTPDFGHPGWTDALDLHSYKVQGELAKAFNAIIPGSVAAPMSR